MKRFVFTFLSAALLCLSQGKVTPVGDWSGTLDVGGQKLRIVFHIKEQAGNLTATFDSPDQGGKDIRALGIGRDGTALKIDMPNGATFEGVIADAPGKTFNNEIVGRLRQSGGQYPLTLKRMSAAELAASKPKRPQIPAKPYPYDEREVTAANKSAPGVTLACTLTVPRGNGPFPAVLTITGSGPQERNEEVMGHPVFLVLADHLTRKGIAVMRCDDRGIGKSKGEFRKATTADFATDVQAEFDVLKTQPKIDPKRCGLIGHSEGGVIAPMVASRRPDVAFIVMMSGTGVRGRDVILSQKEAILKANGMQKVDVSADRAVYDAAIAGKDASAIAAAGKGMFPPGTPDDVVKQQLTTMLSPWFVYFLKYDPAPALAKVKQPVLALFGEKDLQVIPSVNEPAVRTALKNNKNASIQTVPGVNHLYQTAQTGSPTEYPKIEETISPKALNLISDWILSVAGKPRQ